MPQSSRSQNSGKRRLPSEELITEEVTLKMELIQSLIEPCVLP